MDFNLVVLHSRRMNHLLITFADACDYRPESVTTFSLYLHHLGANHQHSGTSFTCCVFFPLQHLPFFVMKNNN